jgi:hypothetical protein
VFRQNGDWEAKKSNVRVDDKRRQARPTLDHWQHITTKDQPNASDKVFEVDLACANLSS